MEEIQQLEMTKEEIQMMETGEGDVSTPDITPEPTPVQSLDVEPEPTPDPATQKTVPLAALHEARTEIKELKSRLGAVDQLKLQFEELRKANTPPPEPVPDYNDDPFGYTKHQLEQQAQTQQSILQRMQQNETIHQQQQLISTVGTMENEFKQTHQDYPEAFNFIKELRRAELEEYGITDQDTVIKDLNASAANITLTALRQNKNPAEVIYNLAKRYGYKGPAIPVPPPPPSKLLDIVEKGQQIAGKTLSTGGQGPDTLTAESLLTMEGDEFDRNWEKLFGKR